MNHWAEIILKWARIKEPYIFPGTKAAAKMSDRRCRIVLTPELAFEIYAQKLGLLMPRTFRSCIDVSRLLRGKSSVVAMKYNVSPKTIRDIWNRKTWTSATFSLWERDYSLVINCSYDQVASFRNSGSRTGADISHFWQVQEEGEQIHSGPFGQTYALHGYTLLSVNENDVGVVENLHQHQSAQESNRMTLPESNYQQAAVVGSFISVMDDAEFLPSSTMTPKTSSSPISSDMQSDPFHSDWPYWNLIWSSRCKSCALPFRQQKALFSVTNQPIPQSWLHLPRASLFWS